MRKAINPLLSFVRILPFLLVLSTVFVVNPALGNGVVSGKYFWFYLSMGVLVVTSVWVVFRSPVRMRFNRLDGLILLFGSVSLSLSLCLHHSEAVTKHILFVLVILLYFCARTHLSHLSPGPSPQERGGRGRMGSYWVMLFFLVTGLVEAYWGVRQLYGLDYSQHSRFRLTGSFFNPGPYACYLSVVLPAAFYYMIRHWDCTKVRFRLRYWAVYLRWGVASLTVAGILLVLPAAMSRASWLAALGGCGLVGCFYLAKNHRFRAFYQACRRRRLAFGASLTSLILTVVLAGAGMYYLKKDSADGRALIWKISMRAIAHHPMGAGIGHFSAAYGQEQAAYFASGAGTAQEQYVAGNPEYGFNEYLQIALEQGLIPLILFASIAGYALYIGLKRKRIAPTASLLALLITALMSYPFSLLPFLIIFALLLSEINKNKYTNPPSTPLSCGEGPGERWVTVLLVAFCLYTTYPRYQAYKDWRKAEFLYQSGVYEQAGEAYAPLYPLLSDELKFLFEYAQSLSKTERYEESNEVLAKALRISCDPMLHNIMGKNHQAMKRYAEAETCFLKAAHTVPSRLYPWYLLTKLHVETGDTEKARETAQMVLTKEPKVQTTAVREMREEVRKIIQ
jgi:tetratricopeptide (TPR) repeat protein